MSEEQTTTIATQPPAVTPLPDPVPARGGSQPNFTARGNTFVAALPTWISELNAAMTWIKETADALQAAGDDTLQDLDQHLADIDTAKVAALGTLQEVLDQITWISAEIEGVEEHIDALRDQMLAEIEQAKQDAVTQIQLECEGGA